MIITLITNIIINSLSFFLAPLNFVHDIFGNILENVGLVQLIRLSSFFLTPTLLTFLIDTLVFWFSAFMLRPLVNFIRSRS